MANYESLQDHDLLQCRTNRLISFTIGLIVGAIIMAFIAVGMQGMADESELRENASLAKIESAGVGQHIRVNGVGLLKTSHHAGRVE